MWKDILIQAGFFLVSAFMYLWTLQIPQKTYSKFRAYQARHITQAKRHFVRGAQLLEQARASPNPAQSKSLAGLAVAEADLAIQLIPSDAASHILKALALNLQGFRTSALEAIEAALSPIAVKSLSEEERGDALLRRAEMKIGLTGTQPELVDSAIEDLIESVKLRVDNAWAYCVLGGCYEKKGLVGEAKKVYKEAVRLEPKSAAARDGLARLSL